MHTINHMCQQQTCLFCDDQYHFSTIQTWTKVRTEFSHSAPISTDMEQQVAVGLGRKIRPHPLNRQVWKVHER